MAKPRKVPARRPAALTLAKRLAVARLLLGLGLLLGILISLRLWLTGRVFPHLPCFDWLPPSPAPWDGALLAATLLALLAYLLNPRLRWLLGLAMLACLLLAVQDQIRWQPWFYLYLLNLAGFLLLGPEPEPARQRALLGILQVSLVAMYFWSGFHKLGPQFPNLIESAFAEPLKFKWPSWLRGLLVTSSPAVPWFEMLTACLLLLPWTRKAGVVCAVSTHLFILLLVGPFGLSANHVVWPWNLAMAALVPIVFWNADGIAWRSMVSTPLRYVAVPVVILLGLMPAFSPGRWDRYLSFHLYSGHDERLILVMHEQQLAAIPEKYHRFFWSPPGSGPMRELNFRVWSYRELNVPFPGEPRMNLAVGKVLARLPLPDHPLVYFYFDHEFQREERGWDRFTPQELLALDHFPEPRLEFVKNP